MPRLELQARRIAAAAQSGLSLCHISFEPATGTLDTPILPHMQQRSSQTICHLLAGSC